MKLNKTAFEIARARQCVSMTSLAKSANVAPKTICTGFTEDIDPVAVGKIAAVLDVDVTEIITQDE